MAAQQAGDVAQNSFWVFLWQAAWGIFLRLLGGDAALPVAQVDPAAHFDTEAIEVVSVAEPQPMPLGDSGVPILAFALGHRAQAQQLLSYFGIALPGTAVLALVAWQAVGKASW